jgi:hypothetical protein
MRNVEKLISSFGLRGAYLARPSVRPRTRTRPRRRCASFDFEDDVAKLSIKLENRYPLSVVCPLSSDT